MARKGEETVTLTVAREAQGVAWAQGHSDGMRDAIQIAGKALVVVGLLWIAFATGKLDKLLGQLHGSIAIE
jgi:hypothetical protein